MKQSKIKLLSMPNNIVIQTGNVKWEFGIKPNFQLSQISDISGNSFLGTFRKTDSIWKLYFQNSEGTKIDLESASGKFEKYTHSEFSTNIIIVGFHWSLFFPDNQRGEAIVKIGFESGNSLSHWTMDVKIPMGWKLIQSDFPITPNVNRGKDLKMAIPSGWGLEYKLKPGFELKGVYPSCIFSMQFLAFYRKGAGLYVGTHDKNAYHKEFQIRSNRTSVNTTVTFYPGIPNKSGGIHHSPFETVIGLYQGDYYEAAQIYRTFSCQTTWGNIPIVTKRKIPKWLLNTNLWLRPDGSAEMNLDITKKALKYFDSNISLHWYRWHKIPYDTLYPEYFPPLSGFKNAIHELHEAGTQVMPYINGRLFDPASKSWKSKKAYNYAARNEKGEFYTEIYGSKVPLNVMCPYTKFWQDTVKNLVQRLIRELHVDGVYIDQIGAAHAVQCFNPEHGHPVGGGKFWYEGYRKMLNQIRKKLPRGKILTTEENIECWIDQFDALLVVNTLNNLGGEPNPIPLFPAVYSDRAITFGFMYFPKDDLEKSIPFRYKMSLAYLWGAQLGWIQPFQILDPKYKMEAEFLRNLSQCRKYAKSILNGGKFLGMLGLKGKNPRLTCTATGSLRGTYKIETSSVLSSCWESQDGEIGILIVNMNNHPQSVQIPIGKIKLRDLLVKKIKLKIYGRNGLESKINKPINSYSMTIPPRDAVVIHLSKS